MPLIIIKKASKKKKVKPAAQPYGLITIACLCSMSSVGWRSTGTLSLNLSEAGVRHDSSNLTRMLNQLVKLKLAMRQKAAGGALEWRLTEAGSNIVDRLFSL